MTRRWLLRTGAGALLSGFSGMPGEAQTPLPPGLYLPSTNHLGHALKAAASAHPYANYTPQFFSPAEFATVRSIAAIALGLDQGAPVLNEICGWIDQTVYDAADVRAAARALSPAHRAVAVAYYGTDSVARLETFDAQAICRAGLPAARDRDVRALLQLAPSDGPAARFVQYIKERAIDGYYTSREGLHELDYKGNSFYAESPGCAHV